MQALHAIRTVEDLREYAVSRANQVLVSEPRYTSETPEELFAELVV